jgi:hypothetical protein
MTQEFPVIARRRESKTVHARFWGVTMTKLFKVASFQGPTHTYSAFWGYSDENEFHL